MQWAPGEQRDIEEDQYTALRCLSVQLLTILDKSVLPLRWGGCRGGSGGSAGALCCFCSMAPSLAPPLAPLLAWLDNDRRSGRGGAAGEQEIEG